VKSEDISNFDSIKVCISFERVLLTQSEKINMTDKTMCVIILCLRDTVLKKAMNEKFATAM
jgi:hypothetical protein